MPRTATCCRRSLDGPLAGLAWEPQRYRYPPRCHCQIAHPPFHCTACAVPRAFSLPLPCFVRFGGTKRSPHTLGVNWVTPGPEIRQLAQAVAQLAKLVTPGLGYARFRLGTQH
eukprot:353827-Chlamydomonas_euryale.AAC.9